MLILLDGLIVLLLLVVLALGVVLHRRLQRLRMGDGELARLVENVNGAVAQAGAALADLKQTALETGERLDFDRASVQQLIGDLKMLSERAEREADRLAEAICAVPPRGDGAAVQRSVLTAQVAQRNAPRGGSEELEQALRSLR